MNIYIASSWKNVHAVELLTCELRSMGHEVHSFVENNFGEWDTEKRPDPMPFDEWVLSESGKQAFDFDTAWASKSDLMIYVGPSGVDAWAEVGIAWACDLVIFGLHAKGEPSGLMRRLMNRWTSHSSELLGWVREMEQGVKVTAADAAGGGRERKG